MSSIFQLDMITLAFTRVNIQKPVFSESSITLSKFVTNGYREKALYVITLACIFLGIFIISTIILRCSHMVTFTDKLLVFILVYFCRSLRKKLGEYVETHITTMFSRFILRTFPPKLFSVCSMLVSKLNENCIKGCYSLLHKYPSVFLTLVSYYSVYSEFSKIYPTILLWLKKAYCAFFLIVICSGDPYLYIVFAAFSASNLMLIYICHIKPDFSIKHPLLYWFFLTVSLLIIVYSLMVFAHIGLTYIYTKIPGEPAGGGPSGNGPQGSQGGPPGDKNPNPHMPQDSTEEYRSKKAKVAKYNAWYRKSSLFNEKKDNNGQTPRDRALSKRRERRKNEREKAAESKARNRNSREDELKELNKLERKRQSNRAYQKSDKGKATQKRYRMSEKGINTKKINNILNSIPLVNE